VPAFLFLHAGSLVHYRPPFSRDPAPRVAFLLENAFTVPKSAAHVVLSAFCQGCGDAGVRLASATAVTDLSLRHQAPVPGGDTGRHTRHWTC
jgi:hypothetical protein